MSLIAYTIVTENYYPLAKTLAESFKKHNSLIQFHICMIDGENNDVISTAVLEKNKYADMRKRYDNMALICALKPYFAEYFLKNEDCSSIVYFDADMLIFNNIDSLREILDEKNEEKSIILTPHVLSPMTSSNKDMTKNINYLTYGVFNAGFFAVKNTVSGNNFISWWKDILFKYCKNDIKNGIFYDQSWLSLVPVYFNKSFYMLSNPGYNVAYWNIAERNITKEGNKFFCNNILLVMYHFARFDYYEKEPTGNIATMNPLMNEIFDHYKMLLKKNRFEEYIKPAQVHSYKKNKLPIIINKLKSLFQ